MAFSLNKGEVKYLRLEFYSILTGERIDPLNNIGLFQIISSGCSTQTGDTIVIPWTEMNRVSLGVYCYSLEIDDRFQKDVTYIVYYKGTDPNDLSIGNNIEEFRIIDDQAKFEDYMMFAKTCNISGRGCY